MKATVFHNPKAGKKGYSKDNILAALKLADHSARYVSTKSDEFRKELEKVDTDFLVVAGGDGTVAEVIANTGNRKLPIGILPMGTANNIARSLAIGGEPQIVVETWRLEKTRLLDIGRAEASWGTQLFVEAFGVGIMADMILSADSKGKEKGAHNLSKGRELLRQIVLDAKTLDLNIIIDGAKLDGDWLGLEVMNIPYTGPGLCLAPKTDFTDGMLDVVCFEKEKRDEIAEWFLAPADKPPPATIRRGKMITLTWRNAPNRVDDEAYKAEDKPKVVTLQCDEEQVKILESRLEIEHSAPVPMEAAK